MQTWAQVLTRTRGGCVVHRCQNKNQIERLTSGCEWRHALEARARGGFWGFWKSQSSWDLPREKTVGFRLLAEARPVAFATGTHEMGRGGRWKSQNKKNVYLSPYVEEPLNSKVIKSFVPELRSRVFRVSRLLCIYVTNIMNVLRTGMNMSISRISVSGYGTITAKITYSLIVPWVMNVGHQMYAFYKSLLKMHIHLWLMWKMHILLWLMWKGHQMYASLL